MANEWTEYTVEQIADVIGGGTPSTVDENNFGGDIAWITPKDLSNHQFRYIQRGERNITEMGLNNSNTTLLPKGSVLLSSRAPVGYLAIAANPLSTNQGFKSLIVRDGFDNEFVYYLLKANVEYLKSQASGTTFGELSGGTLKRLRFSLPPLPEQQSIAEVLGALDDKIELNRRMNTTLEAMAKVLFRQWFVESEEVKEWEIRKLSDIAYFIKGVSYRSSELVEFSDTALVTLKCVERGGGYKEDGLKPFSGKYKSAQRVFPGEVVIAHTDLTQAADVVGRASRVEPNEKYPILVASLDMVIVRPKGKPYSPEYLYGVLSRGEFADHAYGYTNGTTVLHLSSKALPEYPIKIPPKGKAEDYTKMVSPIYAQIDNNKGQSRTLASLRDGLLPKLMMGEARVKDVPANKKGWNDD